MGARNDIVAPLKRESIQKVKLYNGYMTMFLKNN